jgi:hypothetical protein
MIIEKEGLEPEAAQETQSGRKEKRKNDGGAGRQGEGGGRENKFNHKGHKGFHKGHKGCADGRRGTGGVGLEVWN